ncbi:HlyC/CorC family transporter [Rhodobium gokarnense]|uniref:Mg2+/Co2+ transporter CorB n=1 Tax=Rhodobium gokarnense TaxID=364296 RepID=A0ABT3H9P7_9HYPH|nr:HlyC/CorC family transporter [Rhodobium gokarnense]MCW2307120.1 Mg2+/Co2+ transporter CorB [Rhodobium gokarnense]
MTDIALWLMIGGIFALLILSAFFSGSETALTAASRARMHQLEKTGDRRAEIVSRLIATRERLIGALLLGNNLVNILASALATSVLITLFGDAGVAYATLIMTLLVLVFAEVLPKTWAIGDPDRFAIAVSPLVRIIVFVFGPLIAGIEIFVRWLLRAFGAVVDENQAVLSAREELRGAVDLQHLEGGLIKAERDRLGGLLDLSELEVSDVMVHRTNMEMLNADDPPEKLVDAILSSSFTRLPLWQGEQENIVGVIHAKDLLRSLAEVHWDATKLDFNAVIAAPWFVPDTTNLHDQLNAFLRKKTHFAMVVDEYGEVMGLVTLEDILEEIVGEISDEHDVVVEGVRPQPDGSVLVDGSVPIRDLNRVMDWELPDEEATTIAGLVIHEARMIPEERQAFTFYGFKFVVLRKLKNRITRLRITTAPAEQ